MKTITAALMLSVFAGAASATTISDLDLNSLSFTVDSWVALPTDSNRGSSATGTSNGIGYSITTSAFYLPLSSQNEAQTYNDIPGRSFDDLHLSYDTTITFDRAISSLLVALGNNNNSYDGPNFGMDPVDMVDATASGGQVTINDIQGALVYYEFGATTTVVHVNSNAILDGFDVSFFAEPASVPLPASLPLGAAALAGLGFVARRRKV